MKRRQILAFICGLVALTTTLKPVPSVSLTPEITTPVTSTSDVKIEGKELEKFRGELTVSNEMPAHKAIKPSPDLFEDPRLFFDQPSNPEPKLKSGILIMLLVNGKTPFQVQVQVLSSQISVRDFNIFELNDYGGGKVYKVKQKSNVWYFNLVPTKGSSGTVVVVWKHDPSRPSQVQ